VIITGGSPADPVGSSVVAGGDSAETDEHDDEPGPDEYECAGRTGEQSEPGEWRAGEPVVERHGGDTDPRSSAHQ
jgi:hypothetical protein